MTHEPETPNRWAPYNHTATKQFLYILYISCRAAVPRTTIPIYPNKLAAGPVQLARFPFHSFSCSQYAEQHGSQYYIRPSGRFNLIIITIIILSSFVVSFALSVKINIDVSCLFVKKIVKSTSVFFFFFWNNTINVIVVHFRWITNNCHNFRVWIWIQPGRNNNLLLLLTLKTHYPHPTPD